MTVQSKIEADGTAVLTVLASNLDRSNVAEFKTVVSEAIANSSGRLEVNCVKLEFLDSSGVGALLHSHNSLPEERRPVRLTSVGPRVLTILELMQVHRLFERVPKN